MFCPKCGEQDRDDAKFCRTCGARLSLIALVLEGKLPADFGRDRQKHANGVKCTAISIGLALIAVMVLYLAPAKEAWAIFFATMVAACIIFGVGLGEFVGAGHGPQYASSDDSDTARLSPSQRAELSAGREPANIIGSASITENTTRNLDAEINEVRVSPSDSRVGEKRFDS